MAAPLRGVVGARVPPNSKTLEEAGRRTFDFFKTACRSLPSVMEIYNLHDVVTVSQLRSTISAEIRKNAHVTNPKVCKTFFQFQFFVPFLYAFLSGCNHLRSRLVIDMLLFKAMEELTNIVDHAKQRHHLIGQYVLGREGLVKNVDTKDKGISDFLKRFYETNYF
ncbi:NADH dehydrogenase [ubiquinone] 1 alpha subcomplex subunit 6 [Apostasia shenzhenica]|uniref:NADH dehydrogenase [ubiquinone] 1 alpha subcomplex subunit 6 n=1 Tax=Apostasia shenzhenica TaxID=1088818 RepID=A0A2I0ASE9_9ASPA|nr:NADH dehydrogenase [ubiquinone] 1 alpha subcomplex subunit 6 [Apostasia shenzhenica]